MIKNRFDAEGQLRFEVKLSVHSGKYIAELSFGLACK